MDYQEYIAAGGTPFDWYNMAANGGPGAAAYPNQAPVYQPPAYTNYGLQSEAVQSSGAAPNTVGTGPNGTTTNYNPSLFASDTDAARLAKQYGGKVISAPLREAGGGTLGSPFSMPNANYIQLANGAVVNAGTISQWQSLGRNDLIQNEISHPAPTTGTGADSWYQQYAPTAAAAKKAAGTPATGTGTTPTGTGGTPAQQYPNLGLTPSNPAGSIPLATQTPRAIGGEGDTGLNAGLLPGGYGVGAPGPMPYGTGAIGGTPTTFGYNQSNNVGDILSNDRQYAYGQGGQLIANYGEGLAQFNQRGRSLGAVGDSAYANLLQNPGYTAAQAAGITNQAGLDELNWTPEMAAENQLTPAEYAASIGNPNAGLNTYNAQAENLRQDARNYQTGVSSVYDTGATDLNTATGGLSQRLDNAIDPSQLGLSSEYQQNYNFGPQQQQDLIEDAGRTVGQGTAAVTDQLQRQANAAGAGSPLALAAAQDRQRQTGAVASADAMTKARIQAAQLGLTTEQTKEQTRLGTAQDISGRRMSAATTAGQADIANQQFLTAGRANAATTTGQAYLNEQNEIANQQTSLASAADATAAQRAQALAQNRQTVNQANQASQFSRGSYQDQAASQRATQVAGAARTDQTAARQDIRNEEQTAYNESNSMMAGQLQAFGGVTGAGQSSEQNAIRSAQLPTTLDKVIGAASGAAAGAGYERGGVVNQPTVARVGENGPEIIIKLGGMNYKRRNEVPTYA